MEMQTNPDQQMSEFVQNLSQNFDFCTCLSHNALKRNAGGKNGKRLCCKRVFNRIKGNWAEIEPKNCQNVQKTHFLQKVPGVNGLNIYNINNNSI